MVRIYLINWLQNPNQSRYMVIWKFDSLCIPLASARSLNDATVSRTRHRWATFQALMYVRGLCAGSVICHGDSMVCVCVGVGHPRPVAKTWRAKSAPLQPEPWTRAAQKYAARRARTPARCRHINYPVMPRLFAVNCKFSTARAASNPNPNRPHRIVIDFWSVEAARKIFANQFPIEV